MAVKRLIRTVNPKSKDAPVEIGNPNVKTTGTKGGEPGGELRLILVRPKNAKAHYRRIRVKRR